MEMNKAFFKRKEDRKPKWRIIDAKDQVLGRMATRVADILRGKDKPEYTPHTDTGDYVVIINAKHVKLTGDKWKKKIYARYTGWIGGYKETTAEKMREKFPERIIELAVERMLPKNKLSRQIFKKLKVYPEDKHPHEAQLAQK